MGPIIDKIYHIYLVCGPDSLWRRSATAEFYYGGTTTSPPAPPYSPATDNKVLWTTKAADGRLWKDSES